MTTALKSSIARLGNKLNDLKKDAQYLMVAIDLCDRYSRQVRTVFAEGPLLELSESIKVNGIIEPLLARPIGNGRYEIIAGERRMRAARMAGLKVLPLLVKDLDDEAAYRLHLAENNHRENLSTLELAVSVQRDVDAANGVLEKVAQQYNKTKSWISKMLAIARGGESMVELVEEGVTSDRAVLSAVSSLEQRSPEKAKALAEQLKAAPPKVNKRHITEGFMKADKTERTQQASSAGKGVSASKSSGTKANGKDQATAAEPAWRTKTTIERGNTEILIVVELSPHSRYASEFADLSKKYGKARLVMSERHPEQAYAVVQFGNTALHRRVYQADELRLLAVQ
ncbi:ParB/RepB/Spo0J family partition protein [Aquabacterium soli]|uniref:ParB/RepB/Spo0J family partition protein n=1 Tax=Aquabacterium soli TaxID=2493092 RepID=A0A426V2S2_9BURK|nr:ParB/RepB/Spo0J family partition protein [Aquabacterium soli]RRS01155.1 ParB/RepB/Spo0J family partition protein [Aquabacterium soli]